MKKLVTIVVPLFNEEEVLSLFYRRVDSVLKTIPGYRFEILFVDDGSKDRSPDIIQELAADDDRVSWVRLSRNYGKEIAMAAGLDHVTGDAAIIIDADLQDPPELMVDFIRKWEEGFDDVYAQRTNRKGESILKRSSSWLFYRILERISSIDIQKDTGDFRLLDKRAIDALTRYRESERYTKGLFSLIGFNKIGIQYVRDPRAAGKTKWSYLKLVKLAFEGITSFTTVPLRASTYIGIFFAFVSFCYMGFIIFKTIVYGDPVRGYPSLVSIVLFLGGIQLVSLGIIGEYIGRTFLETKNRPLYFIQEYKSRNKKQKQ